MPVPDSPDHVIYVWLAALVTYVTAAPEGEHGWEAASTRTHFIGKDILTFHGVYWSALLLAGGLTLPDYIVANGWLTVDGRKIAKSDPDTIVDPTALAREVGNDGLPWYLIRGVSLGQDVNFDRDHLRTVLNADLANGLGNLLSRTVALSRKRFPDGLTEVTETDVATCRDLQAMIDGVAGDRQQSEPRKQSDPACASLLATVLKGLCDLSVVAAVFLPEVSKRIRGTLGLTVSSCWNDIGTQTWGTLSDQDPIFARLL